jgi:hypothetical protein
VQPVEGYKPPGSDSLSFLTALREIDLRVDSFKELASKFIPLFNWISASNMLMSLDIIIDFRTNTIVEGVQSKNVRGIIFPLNSTGDPVVAVHNFMNNIFNHKLFWSLHDFKYPLKEGKEISAKARSKYLRDRFRKYSLDEKTCLVYIPGTPIFGKGSDENKGQALVKASLNFVLRYLSASIEELNVFSFLCPICENEKHFIEQCPL